MLGDKHPSHYLPSFYDQNLFLSPAVFILPWMFMGQWNPQLHIWEALSHSHFQIIRDAGENFEAGGKQVLNSPCSDSLALIRFVILHAKEMNTSSQIFLRLTVKPKQIPPLNQNVQDKSRLFTNKPKSPWGYSHEACIIYCSFPTGKKDGLH